MGIKDHPVIAVGGFACAVFGLGIVVHDHIVAPKEALSAMIWCDSFQLPRDMLESLKLTKSQILEELKARESQALDSNKNEVKPRDGRSRNATCNSELYDELRSLDSHYANSIRDGLPDNCSNLSTMFKAVIHNGGTKAASTVRFQMNHISVAEVSRNAQESTLEKPPFIDLDVLQPEETVTVTLWSNAPLQSSAFDWETLFNMEYSPKLTHSSGIGEIDVAACKPVGKIARWIDDHIVWFFIPVFAFAMVVMFVWANDTYMQMRSGLASAKAEKVAAPSSSEGRETKDEPDTKPPGS